MNLKDCKIKDYSVDIFRAFANLVGKRLGISDSREYKKHIEEYCKSIAKALDEFRKAIPSDEDERFKWQSSVHNESGEYVKDVYKAYFDQVFIKSLNNFIKVYEGACVGLLMPLKLSKFRSVFRRIFSKNKKQPEITPSERDYMFSTLLELKREAHRQACCFFDEICAHDDFKNLSVHMPQRFADGTTEWDRGKMEVDDVTYILPTENLKFKNIGATKNIIVDKKNKYYYLRDNSANLYKFDKEGDVIGNVSQGSFGEPLSKIINKYKKFFDL